MSASTAWRYVNETVELPTARAPTLDRALRTATKAAHAFVVIDATLIPIDRVSADRPLSSGKHQIHGMNVQVIATPQSEILWTSGTLPGSVHDLKAANRSQPVTSPRPSTSFRLAWPPDEKRSVMHSRLKVPLNCENSPYAEP